MKPRKIQERHDGFGQIMIRLERRLEKNYSFKNQILHLGHINKNLEGENSYNNLMKKLLRAL